MFFNKMKREIKWLKEDVRALEEGTDDFRKYEKLFYQVMEKNDKVLEELTKRISELNIYKQMWEDLEIEGNASGSFKEHLKAIKGRYFVTTGIDIREQ